MEEKTEDRRVEPKVEQEVAEGPKDESRIRSITDESLQGDLAEQGDVANAQEDDVRVDDTTSRPTPENADRSFDVGPSLSGPVKVDNLEQREEGVADFPAQKLIPISSSNSVEKVDNPLQEERCMSI